MKSLQPFLSSLKIQYRVIGALLMREIITRYGRHNVGFLWLFVEPALFTSLITFIWHYTRANNIKSIPITAFAITGYSSLLLWRNIVNRGQSAVSANNAVLYHRNVNILDIFISRAIIEIAGVVSSFVFLSVLFTSIGWMKLPEDLMKVVCALFLLAWFGASLGLIIGSLSERFEVFRRFWRALSYFMMMLSGLVYLVEWLPLAGQKFVLLFPMVHGLELLRDGYFGSTFSAHYNILYMSICCLCLMLIGLILINHTERRIQPE